MNPLPRRPLGDSGIDVSVMSLGSWRTFERISRERGLGVMTAAREAGIDFLDDARYDDELGTAPMPTGYSEVVFGELFRAAGWNRDEVTVANKLWWEHWPDEDADAELTASLRRMGLDHVDLVYAIKPPDGMAMEDLVDQVQSLIDSGKARHWGTGMWSASQHHQALDICGRVGAPGPVAAQMANSLVDNIGPTDNEMVGAFERGNIGLVASYVLAGGILTGKYSRGETGRVESGAGIDPANAEVVAQVVDLARRWGVPPGHVAFAYAFAHPNLASVLFGATSADQVSENVGAWDTYARLDDAQRREIAQLGDHALGS